MIVSHDESGALGNVGMDGTEMNEKREGRGSGKGKVRGFGKMREKGNSETHWVTECCNPSCREMVRKETLKEKNKGREMGDGKMKMTGVSSVEKKKKKEKVHDSSIRMSTIRERERGVRTCARVRIYVDLIGPPSARDHIVSFSLRTQI